VSDDCRCGACVRCVEVIERSEPEEPPTCGCGERIFGTMVLCGICAYDKALASIDWAAGDEAAE
jgi:hypothetical protein